MPKSIVASFHITGGDVAEIFKPLDVSLGASLESRLSPYSWLLRLGSTPNEAKGGRPYYVTKDNLLSKVTLNWMSYLGVRDLTIDNQRWQDTKMNTRKHNAETQYIYMARK